MTISPIVLLSIRVKKMNKESGGVPLFIRSVPPSYQGPKGEEDEHEYQTRRKSKSLEAPEKPAQAYCNRLEPRLT